MWSAAPGPAGRSDWSQWTRNDGWPVPELLREHTASYDGSRMLPPPSSPGDEGAPDVAADVGGALQAPGPAAGSSPGPAEPPHPVDDAAWRYVHDLDEPRPGEGTPPFGLPVLAEIPGLATVLEQLREADRLIARALEGILLLQDHADVAGTTGVGIEGWVTAIARRTRADARMLLAAAEMARRLPTLRAAFQEGRLSWAQVRSVALKTRRLPGHLDDRVDTAIAKALDGVGGAEPDAVTRVISWSLAALQPEEVESRERSESEREFLSLQPRLDGSGGRLWGELGPTSWAVVDAALGEAAAPGATARDDDPATTDPAATDLPSPAVDATPARGEGQASPGSAARARARRLVALLDASLTSGSAPPASGSDALTGATPGSQGEEPSRDVPRSAPSRPQLLLRADLDSLLDRQRTPSTLLTTLLGGHVHVSSRTAQRLLDARGADLRTVILDDTGGVVGVGRRQRVAPGWLRDAVLALHDTCATPGCTAPARCADMDHARPWHPVHPDDLPGTTDVAELAPACARHNQRKERDGWQVEQTTDGRRRWVHRRSGLHTVTVPATWRPSSDPPGPTPPEEPAS